MRKSIKNQLTIGKVLIVLGGIWLIVYSILAAAKVYSPEHYGWILTWEVMLTIGILYLILPYSIKPDLWTRIWSIAVSVISILAIVYCFTRDGLDYNLVWTYLNPLPHFVIIIGAVFWFIQGK